MFSASNCSSVCLDFLIGCLLLRLGDGSNPLGDVPIFLTRRWMRTLPLYFLVLGTLTLVPSLEPRPEQDTLRYWFFAQNLLSPMPRSNWFGISWSLVIEEWSYILLPFLAFLIFKRRQHGVAKAALTLVTIAFAIRFAAFFPDAGWEPRDQEVCSGTDRCAGIWCSLRLALGSATAESRALCEGIFAFQLAPDRSLILVRDKHHGLRRHLGARPLFSHTCLSTHGRLPVFPQLAAAPLARCCRKRGILCGNQLRALSNALAGDVTGRTPAERFETCLLPLNVDPGCCSAELRC